MRRVIPSILTAVLLLVALAACSDRTESAESSASGPGADAGDSVEEETSAGGVEVIPFGATEEDYKSFADWNSLAPFERSMNEQNREGTRAHAVDQFFRRHGLPTYSEYRRDEQYGNGEQLIEFLNERRDMIRALNRDTSDPRNAEIAEYLIEGIMWDSDEEERFRQELRDVREGLVEPEDTGHPGNYRYQRTTRYTSFPVEREVEVDGRWLSTRVDRFIVEYVTTNDSGEEMRVTEIVENSRIGQNPPRIWSTHYGEDESASVDWGRGTVVELER